MALPQSSTAGSPMEYQMELSHELWSPDMDWEPEPLQSRKPSLMDYEIEVSRSRRGSSGSFGLSAPATSRRGSSDPAPSIVGIASAPRTSKLVQEMSVSDIDTPTTPTMTRETTTTTTTRTGPEEATTPITSCAPSPRSRPVTSDFLDDMEPTRIHLAKILPGINSALAVLDFPATRPRLPRDSHSIPRPDGSAFLLDAGSDCVDKGPSLYAVVEESIQEAAGELVENVDYLLRRGSEDVLGLGIMYKGQGKKKVDPLMADLDQMGKELWVMNKTKK